MKLSTGKIAFLIEFDNGDKQSIYFNPNDPDLSVRFNEMQYRIRKEIESLSDFETNSDGTPINEVNTDTFVKVREIMCKEIDRAFGGDISSVVFKYCNPLAIVDGKYFILHFIESITPEIEKHIKRANAEVEQKMNKHIAKYLK